MLLRTLDNMRAFTHTLISSLAQDDRHIMANKDDSRADTISFRCSPLWKRQVSAAVALKGEDMRVACIEALSRYLKVPAVKDRAA